VHEEHELEKRLNEGNINHKVSQERLGLIRPLAETQNSQDQEKHFASFAFYAVKSLLSLNFVPSVVKIFFLSLRPVSEGSAPLR